MNFIMLFYKIKKGENIMKKIIKIMDSVKFLSSTPLYRTHDFFMNYNDFIWNNYA